MKAFILGIELGKTHLPTKRTPLLLPLAISPFIVNLGANVDEDIHDVDSDELFVTSAVFSPSPSPSPSISIFPDRP